MTCFVIERSLPEGLSDAVIEAAMRFAVTVESDFPDMSWLGGHLTADQRRLFCICAAPSADRVREAARLSDVQCDVVTDARHMRPADYAEPML
jgi:Protein of unknown function (DUF4242)